MGCASDGGALFSSRFYFQPCVCLVQGGPYYARHIDGLGPRRDLTGFPAVRVAWLTESSYTLADSSDPWVNQWSTSNGFGKFRNWRLFPGGRGFCESVSLLGSHLLSF